MSAPAVGCALAPAAVAVAAAASGAAEHAVGGSNALPDMEMSDVPVNSQPAPMQQVRPISLQLPVLVL